MVGTKTLGHCYLCFQVDDVKADLMERYKVLPALSSRLSDLENQNDELKDKNRQLEQKLAAMQVSYLIFNTFICCEPLFFIRIESICD